MFLKILRLSKPNVLCRSWVQIHMMPRPSVARSPSKQNWPCFQVGREGHMLTLTPLSITVTLDNYEHLWTCSCRIKWIAGVLCCPCCCKSNSSKKSGWLASHALEEACDYFCSPYLGWELPDGWELTMTKLWRTLWRIKKRSLYISSTYAPRHKPPHH